MPTTLRTTALALLAVTACLWHRSALAQDADTLLQRLPDTYDAAVLVPNLAALDTGLASFESAAGLGLGELQDTVGRFKRELGLMRGLDETGPMAVVVIEAGPSPLAVMLLPVSDYDALAWSLGAEPGDVVNVTLPSGASGVLRKMDGYAVLGGNQQVVLAYSAAGDAAGFTERFGEDGAAAVSGSHLAVAVHTGAMDGDVATAQLTALAAMALGHADNVLAPDLGPAKRLRYLSSVSQLLASGADGLVAGFTFSAEGMGYTEAYRLTDSSALAGMFPGRADDAVINPEAVLAKLPDDPIVLAVAGDPTAVNLAALADRFGGFFVQLGLDPQHALGGARAPLESLLAQADAIAMAYYAQPDPAQAASRWMNTITVFQVQDERVFAEALETAVLALNDAQVPAGGDEPITFTTSYEPEDRLLGGVRYDTFKVQVHIPQSLRGKPMMLALAGLGEIGFVGQAAVIDGHVVVTTFDEFNTITRAIETVQSGNGLGGGAAQAVANNRTPAAVGYLDLGGIADTLAPFLAIAGNPAAVSVDAGVGPITFAITTQPGQAGLHLFFPAAAMNALARESFEPRFAGDGTQNNGRDADPGSSNPGRQTQPVRPGNDRGPTTRPGRERPGVQPGRPPSRTPGRAPR